MIEELQQTSSEAKKTLKARTLRHIFLLVGLVIIISFEFIAIFGFTLACGLVTQARRCYSISDFLTFTLFFHVVLFVLLFPALLFKPRLAKFFIALFIALFIIVLFFLFLVRI